MIYLRVAFSVSSTGYGWEGHQNYLVKLVHGGARNRTFKGSLRFLEPYLLGTASFFYCDTPHPEPVHRIRLWPWRVITFAAGVDFLTVNYLQFQCLAFTLFHAHHRSELGSVYRAVPSQWIFHQ